MNFIYLFFFFNEYGSGFDCLTAWCLALRVLPILGKNKIKVSWPFCMHHWTHSIWENATYFCFPTFGVVYLKLFQIYKEIYISIQLWAYFDYLEQKGQILITAIMAFFFLIKWPTIQAVTLHILETFMGQSISLYWRGVIRHFVFLK